MLATAFAHHAPLRAVAVPQGGRLMQDVIAIKTALDELGKRLEAKRRELATQGVLHGAERARAAELEVEHQRLLRLTSERAKGSRNAESSAVLAAEAEALRRSFDHWFAEIDRGR
jgi:hypothetical protein